MYLYLSKAIYLKYDKKKYPQGYVLSLARNEKNSCIEDKRDSQVSGPVLTYVLTK